jgi:carbonic anhydrase/acetyltransferase-like protein (isoleucine patch superfamily)
LCDIDGVNYLRYLDAVQLTNTATYTSYIIPIFLRLYLIKEIGRKMAETSSTNNDGKNNIENETASINIIPVNHEEYIHTVTTQSYISRHANIMDATKYMEMKGRSIIYSNVQIHMNPQQHKQQNDDDPVINGRIRIGRYCHIQCHTTIQLPLPSQKRYYGIDDIATVDETKSNNNNNIILMTIGSHTMIGQYCNIQAIAIGSNCYIGDHVIIGTNVIIKDNCIITSYTQIPPNTIVPPFSRCCTKLYNNTNNNNTNHNISDSRNDNSNNNDDDRNNNSLLLIEWNDPRRRHIHFIMSTLPPSIALTLQERAVQAFDAFVIKYKEKQQQAQQ